MHAPVAAVLFALCAVAAVAAPPGAAGVIHRPVQASAQAPTGPIGYSASHMDRSVHPRQDFHAHANGSWLKRLTIPDAESDIGGFSMLGANLDAQLQQWAVKASRGQAAKGSPAQQVGGYYRAALDMPQRDAAGLQPIHADLDEAVRANGPADLGGLTLAHAALHRALKGKPQPKIDGLSTDQRCLVAWAQPWVDKAREERIRVLAATDVHGNSVVRGDAPLMNLDAFHRAFGTRPGDAMWRKPADCVRIW